MAHNFFKKLDENGNPTGDLYILKNLKQVEKTVDWEDMTSIQAAGYCAHLNTPKPIFNIGNYTKEYVNNGDIEIGTDTNVYDHDWQLVTRTLSDDELTSEKNRAWNELRDLRKYYLRITDRFALSDATMSDAIRDYRQALRDLPANTPDPFNVTWPTWPAEIDKDVELQASGIEIPSRD